MTSDMTFATAIAIAILQGVTELFPISSLGHAVVLPKLLGLNIDLRSEHYVPFLVFLHLGTATALLLYFWRDWWELFIGVFVGGKDAQGEDRRRLLLLLVLATLPAVIIGFGLEKKLKALFAKPDYAAAFLIANGAVLIIGEILRRRALGRENPSENAGKISIISAIAIGLWQCLAFLPGISRSGATMVGGLLAKLTHEQAARFSFLMATPVIVGASVLEVPKLLHAEPSGQSIPLEVTLAGGLAAGIAAYLSVAFLMRYFHRHDFAALIPFAIYCVLFGAASLAFL
jgi:undecaprenyl-diphosphatase